MLAETENKKQMLEEYVKDNDHAKEVQKYALMIFDAFNEAGIFNFSLRQREYLKKAARLHDIGYAIESKSHHKHGMKMIISQGLDGFDEEETLVVANIARYHRGSFPDEQKHEYYAELSDENRELVKKLGSILRLADGLDKPHKNLILRIRAVQNDTELLLYIKTIGFKPNLKMAEKKKDMMEEVFQRKVKFLFE